MPKAGHLALMNKKDNAAVQRSWPIVQQHQLHPLDSAEQLADQCGLRPV
jgi:hypothetical protein